MLRCGSVASPDKKRLKCWLPGLILVFALWSHAQEHKPAEAPERFFIVKLATTQAGSSWADYILDVRTSGPDVTVREFQIAPLGRFCSDDVTVKAVEKILPRTTPAQLLRPLKLCSSALRQKVTSALEKYSYRQVVTISDSERFGIVAKCGDDLQTIDLPFPQGLDQNKLQRHSKQTVALFSLFDRLQHEVFGPQPIFHQVGLASDDYDLSLQQTGFKLIDDLRSGDFDRGFGGRNCRGLNSGCGDYALESLLKSYKGPVSSPLGAQVRLMDQGKLPIIRYVPPEYPAAALSARTQDRLPLELELAPSGKVVDVIVLSGNESLRPSAVAAARQWEFKPGSGRFLQMTLDYSFQCP